MTDMQDQKEKLQEYQERYHFWSDKRISQFSFQNNIYLAISIAIMGYFWKERNSVYSDLVIDFRLVVDWKIVFFFIGMTLLLYSIVTGLFLAISRLYDLRLTSNVLLTRKWALKNKVSIDDEDLSNNRICKSIKSLWMVFRKYDEFALFRSEIKSDNSLLQQKFTKIRQLSRDIGSLSWTLMKNQTISLLISIVFFIVVLIMK